MDQVSWEPEQEWHSHSSSATPSGLHSVPSLGTWSAVTNLIPRICYCLHFLRGKIETQRG